MEALDFVVARIAYLAGEHTRIGYRVWPPSSRLPPESPPKEYHDTHIYDWRPIHGPVEDIPLAICEAKSTLPADFVPTDIEHYGEGDLTRPRHTGEIFSVRRSAAHRWFYVSRMRADEILFFKCWASAKDG